MNNAPSRLRQHDKWVCWKIAVRNGTPTKLPIDPNTGGLAAVDRPGSWSNYEKAKRRASADRRLAGVGYVITDHDGLTGVDLDDVVDKATGTIEPWAAELLALAETYAEISPSGTGLRLWIDGKVERSIKSTPLRIELYVNGRYLTFTGNRVEGTPDEIRPAPKTLAALYARLNDAGLQPAPRRPVYDDPTPWQRLNSAALQNLGAWVPHPDLFGNKAKRKRKGYRVSSKALGRDLEEDLSITESGIVDFGIHDLGDPRGGRYTPLDLIVEYGETNFWGAVEWLCERLNREHPLAEVNAEHDDWLWDQAHPAEDSITAKYWRGELSIETVLHDGETS